MICRINRSGIIRQIALVFYSISSCTDAFRFFAWQDDLCCTVCGYRDAVSRFGIAAVPAALDFAVDTLIACLGVCEMAAGSRRDHKMVFARDLDPAHGSEQPFADSSFGIVVQTGYTALRVGAFPALPYGRRTVFRHKKPARHFLVFEEAVSSFNIDLVEYAENERGGKEPRAKPPAVVFKGFQEPLFCKTALFFVQQPHKERPDKECLTVGVQLRKLLIRLPTLFGTSPEMSCIIAFAYCFTDLCHYTKNISGVSCADLRARQYRVFPVVGVHFCGFRPFAVTLSFFYGTIGTDAADHERSVFFHAAVISKENSGKTKIIVGPTGHIPGGDQELRTLAFRADVPRSEIDSFLRGMKSIVPMPLESVLKMLCTVNYILNDEKLELQDITIHETDQMNLKTATESHRVNSTESGRTEVHHNTLAVEEALMNLISHGDTAALREWIAAAPSVRGGTLAADQLRQRKNAFIVTATLSSRAAIRGGMDPNDALSLSDRFIQRSELADTPNKLTNLQYHMVLEFTERVERIRKGGNPTKLTMAVANYVQHHLSEPVTAEDIAKELYLSRPYLSAKFKKESGQTLTDFILTEKTEEAKRLLRYTDKTSSAIGAYLGFSSQGHFSRVFRKYVGFTPNEYRGKYMWE